MTTQCFNRRKLVSVKATALLLAMLARDHCFAQQTAASEIAGGRVEEAAGRLSGADRDRFRKRVFAQANGGAPQVALQEARTRPGAFSAHDLLQIEGSVVETEVRWGRQQALASDEPDRLGQSRSALEHIDELLTRVPTGDDYEDIRRTLRAERVAALHVRPYPIDVMSGGHSGHVAAVGSRFVVFYSEDWVDGGGVDNLGSGNGVYAKAYDKDGVLLQSVDVARRAREWWPMVAGSPKVALLVWQQYVSGETFARLKVATLDPVSGALTQPREIAPRVRYYTYTTAYVPSIARFVVIGTDSAGKGFAQLVDDNGQTTATLACMPASVRESSIAVIGDRVFAPSQDGRLLHFQLTASSIELSGTQPSPIKWASTGSVGLVRSPTQLHWVATSPRGLQEADFNLSDVRPTTESDRCGS